MVSLTWTVSRRDGTFGPPRTAEVDGLLLDHLRTVWAMVREAEPGPARSRLIRELRFMLDSTIVLPDGIFEDREPDEYVPSYVGSRQRES